MKILIVKLSSIGDVVHTLPAVAALRQALPEAIISWVVDCRAAEVLKGSLVIDELIELNTREWKNRLLNPATFREIREHLRLIKGGQTRPDIAIDFQGLIKSGLIAYASGAPRRIGFAKGDLREPASNFFLTEHVEASHLRHVIDKNLRLASAVTKINREAGYRFPITVFPRDEERIQQVIAEHGSPFAIMNPGGGWPTKLWSTDRFAEIADWLWTSYQLVSFVTFGPGEEHLAGRIVGNSKTGAARKIASTIKEFVALAMRAALFIGSDTGPLHLAAASGTPIVGLYGPTAPDRNGPFHQRDVCVGLDLWCRSDCHRRKCWHWECMDISVDDVKAAIRRRLSDGRVE